MKPCDCKDMQDTKKLNEQGIAFNDISIEVIPNQVIIAQGQCTMKMWQKHFERLARWYLEAQHLTPASQRRLPKTDNHL